MSGCVLVLVPAALLLAAVGAGDTQVYFKVGGSLDLQPLQKPQTTVTAVTWKHNEDIVVEWIEPTVDLSFWGVLKGRATMDKTTGKLSITNMTGDMAGKYTAVINNELQVDGYRAAALKEVPVPEVAVQPLTCSSTSETCSLICVGKTTGAESVSIFWRRDNEDWKEEGSTIQILNTKEEQPRSFSCKMVNPVSSQESRPHPNPFASDPGVNVTAIVVSVVILSLIGLGGLVLYFTKRTLVQECMARLWRLGSGRPGSGRPGSGPPASSNGTADHTRNPNPTEESMEPLNSPEPAPTS